MEGRGGEGREKKGGEGGEREGKGKGKESRVPPPLQSYFDHCSGSSKIVDF